MAILLGAVAALATVGLIYVGLRLPTLLLGVYVATVPFGSAVGLPLGLPPPFDSPSSLLGMATIVVLLADATIGAGRRRPASFAGAHALFLAFVGVCALTFGWSIDRTSTVEDVVLLGSVVGLYVISALAHYTKAELERVTTGIVAGGAAAACSGLVLLQTGGIAGGRSGVPRFALTGDDPNHTAGSFLLPMILAADRALDTERPPTDRALWGAAAVVIVAGIAATGSRGGLLAAIVAFVVLVRLRAPRIGLRVAVGAALVVGVVVLVVAPPQLERRLATTGSTGRSDIWRLGLRSCEDHCVLGSGWGSFPAVYREEFREAADVGGFRGEGYRAHNIWLQALVEAGVAGFVVLVAAWAALLRQALRLPASRRSAALAIVVGMAVASSLVSNLTFKYLWLVPMYLTFVAGSEHVAGRREGTATMLAAQTG